MNIPRNAARILQKLENGGFEAYLVGGCVRDTIMNAPIHDYDIATNALPDQILGLFSEYKVIPTGLKHGTVTVLNDGEPFEITTFRVDGDYSDSRRPDSVRFTSSLTEDLSRRDFTINALAMTADSRIIDPFGGADDIENRLIRCVGAPELRFTEDALRIMRALRFASRYGFKIEKSSAEAIHSLRGRLDIIARERIRSELDGILCGKYCADVLLDFSDVIVQIIPELQQCIGFDQCSPYHKYTVWEHIVRAVDSAPESDLTVRRALFFHDIGKPGCFKADENGRGHFKGHALLSAEMTKKIMKRLRYDRESIDQVCCLIRHHSDKLRSVYQMRRLLAKLGSESFFRLICVMKSDNMAKQSFVLAENEELSAFEDEAHRIVNSGECLSLSQIAVNGRDMLDLGFRGREVGAALNKLLLLVIDKELPNERNRLIEYAEKISGDKRGE